MHVCVCMHVVLRKSESVLAVQLLKEASLIDFMRTTPGFRAATRNCSHIGGSEPSRPRKPRESVSVRACVCLFFFFFFFFFFFLYVCVNVQKASRS